MNKSALFPSLAALYFRAPDVQGIRARESIRSSRIQRNPLISHDSDERIARKSKEIQELKSGISRPDAGDQENPSLGAGALLARVPLGHDALGRRRRGHREPARGEGAAIPASRAPATHRVSSFAASSYPSPRAMSAAVLPRSSLRSTLAPCAISVLIVASTSSTPAEASWPAAHISAVSPWA